MSTTSTIPLERERQHNLVLDSFNVEIIIKGELYIPLSLPAKHGLLVAGGREKSGTMERKEGGFELNFPASLKREMDSKRSHLELDYAGVKFFTFRDHLSIQLGSKGAKEGVR